MYRYIIYRNTKFLRFIAYKCVSNTFITEYLQHVPRCINPRIKRRFEKRSPDGRQIPNSSVVHLSRLLILVRSLTYTPYSRNKVAQQHTLIYFLICTSVQNAHSGRAASIKPVRRMRLLCGARISGMTSMLCLSPNPPACLSVHKYFNNDCCSWEDVYVVRAHVCMTPNPLQCKYTLSHTHTHTLFSGYHIQI